MVEQTLLIQDMHNRFSIALLPQLFLPNTICFSPYLLLAGKCRI